MSRATHHNVHTHFVAEREEGPETTMYERRWLVKKMDWSLVDPTIHPHRYIIQGLLGESKMSPRIRLSELRGQKGASIRNADAFRNRGRAMERPQKRIWLDVSTALWLLETTTLKTEKLRFDFDAGGLTWKVDVYLKPLEQFVTVECQAPTLGAAKSLTLPSFIHDAVEVTGTVSTYRLAKLGDLYGAGETLSPEDALRKVRRVVVTGGPGSGKTTVMNQIRARNAGADMGKRIKIAPEVATNVISDSDGRIGVKPPYEDLVRNRWFQRQIYALQRANEELALLDVARYHMGGVLCDRGTLDNAAYLAGRRDEFLRKVSRSELVDEFARYDGVVILGLPPRDVFERVQASVQNDARLETYEQAMERQEAVEEAYAGHPRIAFVREHDLERKMAMAIGAIDLVLQLG